MSLRMVLSAKNRPFNPEQIRICKQASRIAACIVLFCTFSSNVFHRPQHYVSLKILFFCLVLPAARLQCDVCPLDNFFWSKIDQLHHRNLWLKFKPQCCLAKRCEYLSCSVIGYVWYCIGCRCSFPMPASSYSRNSWRCALFLGYNSARLSKEC